MTKPRTLAALVSTSETPAVVAFLAAALNTVKLVSATFLHKLKTLDATSQLAAPCSDAIMDAA